MTRPYGVHQPRELTEMDQFHLASALREQRRFRLDQLAELTEDEARGGNRFGGPEVTSTLKRAATHALTEIELALSRVRDGSYGLCVACGRHISRERLEVLPAAALCMTCQRHAHEHGPPEPARAGKPARR